MNPDSRELQLRHRIAELELELASVLLSEAEGQPNQDLDVDTTANTADEELI
jgi:hypothetical protein